MTVSIIVAIAENRAIGKNNQLLWHMPNDLKHFKEVTSGRTIIMGRKTYESVGKPLPKRRNIVVTRQDMVIPGCEVVKSIEDGLALCAGEDEVFIGGGAEIYKEAIKLTDCIYLTIIHRTFDADTFFPLIDMKEWKEVSREDYQPDEKNPFPYSFITLKRAANNNRRYFVLNFKFHACEILLDLPSVLKRAYKLIDYIYNLRCKVKGLLNFSPYCWQ